MREKRKIGLKDEDIIAVCTFSDGECCIGVRCPRYHICYPEADKEGYIEVEIEEVKQ